MSVPAARPNPPVWAFLLLTFLLSLPFYVLGAFAARASISLPFGLPVSALMFVAPGLAAAILVHREEGRAGVRRLLARVGDARRIRSRWWLAPVFLLLPLIYAGTYVAMRVAGIDLPGLAAPLVAVPLLFAIYFIAAAGEELGWTAYALPRWTSAGSALWVGLVLGLAWALIHVIPDIQAGRSAAWLLSQRSFTVVLRVLIVWIYANTGKSVFAATSFHAMDNVSFSMFPEYDGFARPAITAAMTALCVAGVTIVWGAETLRGRTPATPRRTEVNPAHD